MPIVLSSSSITTPLWSVTLADLERELARRVGPFERYTTGVSVADVVPLTGLASSVEQMGLEGRYLLRRGFLAGGIDDPDTVGAPILGFAAGDRVRLVLAEDPVAGTVEADRNYATQTVSGEAVEVLGFDPRGIRRAVLRGLERSFFVDRVEVSATAYAAERDLTLLVPWLRDPDWVLDLGYLPFGSTDRAALAGQRSAEGMAGHVWLTVGPDPAPATLRLRVLRPYATWVNGADSVTGPTADADVLTAPVDYVVCMAHDWLWDTAKPRLAPLVSDGMGNSEREVRDAAARYRNRLPRRADRVVLPARFRSRLTL